ncbi:glycoside hydrolase family 127 protein [Nonomuraea sp. SYSU D8015]|uniref:glycoside hydrolase family 127 protein n=1 Tax=Nonomuraea sp. SYSU D8015 TaxID=2593644 RepID=UPI0021D3CD04|nr:glycoside hydrolase family 127 protein [Nonomuraea sp. SYSU D8015]
MRLLSSLDHYLATQDGDGVQLHLYAPATIRSGAVLLEVDTGYPWSGRVEVVVRETPGHPWTLSVRVPAWADAAGVDGRRAEPGPTTASRAGGGRATGSSWTSGSGPG